VETAAHRALTPIGATRVAAREAPPAAATIPREGARDFGSLVHRVLEWIDLAAEPAAIAAATRALAPAWGLGPEQADEAATAVGQALALPVLARARRAARVWRELRLWFPEGDALIEGAVDLVFEEQGELVVVDYKTDRIAPDQALTQAAHHAPQLRLYGRGLALASGQRVRQRLVVFTGIGREVPV
jgi:ATP-dependent exoDNAse (exonuclease V) beta subunit